MAVYAGVFGLSEGVYIMVFMVITRDIVGIDQLAFALGVAYCILSIPKTLGPLLAGILFDLAQNYVLPFTLMGGLTAFSALLLFFVNTKRSQLSCFATSEASEDEETDCGLGKKEELVLVTCKETVL